MLRWIFFYTLAVLAVQCLPVLPPLWSALPLLVVAAALLWRRHAAALVLTALAAGFSLTLWQAHSRLADRWPLSRQNEEQQVQGHISSLPEASVLSDPEGGEPQTTWRFRFDPDDPALPRHLRVSWYRSDETLRGGDCWRLTLRVKTPHGSQNPGGFDYEGWLLRQDIGATATVRSALPCDVVGFYPVLRWRQALREAVEDRVPAGIGRALLLALVMGDDSALSDADWQDFRLTGTTHLVAISGFNLAIVAGLVFWLLRWAWSLVPALTRRWPAQQAAAVGAALVATGYALLAGFEPPVTRALAMLWIGVLALLRDRLAHPFRVLALAWGVILLADPLAVMSAGLWLSFGAVAAILWLGTGRLGREPGWRQAIRIQLWLSLLLAPMTLWFFQGAAWIAPFVNLLAVPWFAVLTPMAFAAVVLLFAWPVLGGWLLGLTVQALGVTATALRALAQHYGDGWIAAAPSPGALLLAGLGLLLLAAPRGVPLRVLGLLCCVPALWPVQTAPSRGFTLTTLDVGQGLAVVIRTAHHNLLFDAGPAHAEGFDAGRSVVVPYLLHEGVRRLDLMMISHTDLDHRGGASAVRAVLSPREERGALAATPCAAGQGWEWDGVRFAVLNGPADAQRDRSPDNNGGCVLRVEVNGHAALLPADIERDAEARLLAAPESLKAEILVAPHHGSRTSSTADFVAAVNPDLVIFPAGFSNPFRHPRPEVVERYQALGSRMAMTGHVGAVRVTVDPERGAGEPTEWRRERPRWWWAAIPPVPGAE